MGNIEAAELEEGMGGIGAGGKGGEGEGRRGEGRRGEESDTNVP